MNGTNGRAPRGRRVLAAVAGSAMLVGVGFAPSAQMSDAYFTDAEQANVTFTGRLVPPQVTAVTCTPPPALGGEFMRVSWRWPQTVPPYSGMTPSNVQWRFGSSPLTPTSVSGPDAQGVYTSVLSAPLLSGLLAALLGGTVVIDMRSVSDTWTSPAASTATYTAPLLGTGPPTCVFANAT